MAQLNKIYMTTGAIMVVGFALILGNGSLNSNSDDNSDLIAAEEFWLAVGVPLDGGKLTRIPQGTTLISNEFGLAKVNPGNHKVYSFMLKEAGKVLLESPELVPVFDSETAALPNVLEAKVAARGFLDRLNLEGSEFDITVQSMPLTFLPGQGEEQNCDPTRVKYYCTCVVSKVSGKPASGTRYVLNLCAQTGRILESRGYFPEIKSWDIDVTIQQAKTVALNNQISVGREQVIESIDLKYYVVSEKKWVDSWNMDFDVNVLVPAYRIRFVNRDTVFIDARDGSIAEYSRYIPIPRDN